jgi:hypothetical protein
MLTTLLTYLRHNLHAMFVHYPIALLYTSVALAWPRYWLRRPLVTRLAYYVLGLRLPGAVASALVGPDPATWVPVAVDSWHTLLALTTVLLSLVLLSLRFVAVESLRRRAAAGKLVGSVALLAAGSVTGYFGGIMAGPPDGAPHGLLAPRSCTPSC